MLILAAKIQTWHYCLVKNNGVISLLPSYVLVHHPLFRGALKNPEHNMCMWIFPVLPSIWK